MKVVKREVSTVYPEEPCEPHVMAMSGADHIVRPRHIPLLLFYVARQDGSQVMPTQHLKESLSKMLSKFYPAAGRLRRGKDGKLELVCNNAGVEFVEVTVDGSLSEFEGFKPNKLYTELLDPVPTGFGAAFPDYPITYVQVTRFACGGVSLVTTINHACTDGLSVNQFLTSWSEVARAQEMSNPPFHDRTLLRVQPSKCVDPGFEPKEVRSLTSLEQSAPQRDPASWPTERVFLFTPDQLRRVKKKAIGGGERGTFSTFESINAHIWRSVTKARSLGGQATTKFLTTLDARKRLKPNLPKGYFGNAICFVRAEAQCGELATSPLSFAASCVRDAVAGFSEEYFRKLLGYAQVHENPMVMNVNSGPSAGCDVSAASWSRMGFMGLDFGSGNPVYCSPGNNPFDGSVLMLPTNKGEGYMNVFVALKPEHMERLESDPEFFLADIQ